MNPQAKLVDHMVDFFDAVAEDYDDWAGGVHRRAAARLVDWARPREGDACLDVGTGTGLVASLLADLVGPLGTVIGIDLAEGMLRVARRRASRNTRYMGMPAEDLVFRDATFDLATCGESLTYLVDPIVSLAEVHRALKPRGRLAISCPRRSLSTPAQEAFFGLLGTVLEEEVPLDLPRPPDEYASFGEPEVLCELIEASGFEQLRVTEMVTGDRARTPGQWIDLMAGSGPLTFSIISTLGPLPRARLEAELAAAMAPLGEEAFHYHHSYTFLSAVRR